MLYIDPRGVCGGIALIFLKKSVFEKHPTLHALKYFVKSSKKYLGAHSLTHNAKILAFVLSTPPYIHTRVNLFVRTSLLLYCLDPPAGLRIGEAQLTVPVCSFGCFGSDQSASYPPEMMTLTRVEFCYHWHICPMQSQWCSPLTVDTIGGWEVTGSPHKTYIAANYFPTNLQQRPRQQLQ